MHALYLPETANTKAASVQHVVSFAWPDRLAPFATCVARQSVILVAGNDWFPSVCCHYSCGNDPCLTTSGHAISIATLAILYTVKMCCYGNTGTWCQEARDLLLMSGCWDSSCIMLALQLLKSSSESPGSNKVCNAACSSTFKVKVNAQGNQWWAVTNKDRTTFHHLYSVCVCVCVCVREREREREWVSEWPSTTQPVLLYWSKMVNIWHHFKPQTQSKDVCCGFPK